ncbi:hypothetical protein [Pseudokineococcus sp. 1T1Z-3]|uniref:hypothetical protein n=1 Tax=Pseudokineococcus sp. 1T1Z-3 TaxID=3132745 RepID=UPI00309E3736
MGRTSAARQETERLLLGGAWHPLTKSLTFFAADVEECVASFLDWRGRGVIERTGHPLRRRDLTGDLETLLAELTPMEVAMGRRNLFVPVATDGPYRTMMLRSSWLGTDPGSERAAFATRGVGSVQVTSSPNDPRGLIWPRGFHGIHHLGVMRPVPVEQDDRGYTGRSVGVRISDRGGWIFVDLGDRLPFEDASAYTAPRVKNRFTQQTLIDYAAELGLRPFDADFYASDRTAVLVEHTGPAIWRERLASIADAQSNGNPDRIGIPHPDATTIEPESRTITVIDGIAYHRGEAIWDPSILGTRPPPGWTPKI